MADDVARNIDTATLDRDDGPLCQEDQAAAPTCTPYRAHTNMKHDNQIGDFT